LRYAMEVPGVGCEIEDGVVKQEVSLMPEI